LDMKNDLQNLTEDISRLYEDITQKTESLGQIDSITRLYDELQSQLQGISTEEVDLLQSQIKSTLEQMVGISKSLAVIKTLKVTLNGHDELADLAKKVSGVKDGNAPWRTVNESDSLTDGRHARKSFTYQLNRPPTACHQWQEIRSAEACPRQRNG